jgi:hypothetical protein
MEVSFHFSPEIALQMATLILLGLAAIGSKRK